MAKLTKHAKERLVQRFGLDEDGVIVAGTMFGSVGQHKVIKAGSDEIREINLNGIEIQAIISGGKIVTCVPATMAKEDDAFSTEEKRKIEKSLLDQIGELKHYKEMVEQDSIINAILFIKKKRAYAKKLKARKLALC